jgi:hypothetical protein
MGQNSSAYPGHGEWIFAKTEAQSKSGQGFVLWPKPAAVLDNLRTLAFPKVEMRGLTSARRLPPNANCFALRVFPLGF